MKKSNKQFMLLSALGGIMVVDAHSWTALGPFTQYIPYNSFFMQMFIFISGYFFVYSEDMKVGAYIKKKVTKMLLPCYIWWFIYAFIMWVLNEFTAVNIGAEFSVKRLLLGPILRSEDWSFNAASWFVFPSFAIQVIYILLRKLIGKYWNDWVATIVFAVISYAGIYTVTYGEMKPELINVFRVMVLMVFYQGAILYRKYFETILEKMNGFVVCGFCIVFSAVLENFYGNTEFYFSEMHWRFPDTSWFLRTSSLLPMVTAVIGIAFWLKVCQGLAPVLGESRLLNFISTHTFDIMVNHGIIMWLPNLILAFNKEKILAMDPLFQAELIFTDGWYRWQGLPYTFIFYFIIGLFGTLFVAYLTDKVKANFGKLLMRKK